MIQNEQLRRDVNFVVDCFTKMDGGIHFVKFCKYVNKLEKQAKTDHRAAYQLRVIREFTRIMANVEFRLK